MLRTLLLLSALSAVPTLAAPFGFDFTWTAVAGVGGNSGDFFDFEFVDPSGQLEITELRVTLGDGLIYDLSSAGAGYLTWGAYTAFDGGTGHTMSSAPLGEGSGGNKTGMWSFTNFIGGTTFGYSADVDESGTCPSGFGGVFCAIDVDLVTPAGFVARGGVDVSFTVASVGGGLGQTYHFPSSGQTWDEGVVSARTSYAGDLLLGSQDTPEPATWLLGIGGLALCALYRRKR